MLLLWTLVLIFLLFLLICAAILRFYAHEVLQRQNNLIKALWERRHRVPMLLEGSGIREQGTVKKEIIELRAQLQSEAYTLEEQVELEREFTKLLKDIFQKTEFDPELKTNALHLSLQKEFSDCLEKIRINLNDYNFSLQKFLKLCHLPFFLIFKFAFEISKSKPLGPI